jgi:hypothetical protein
MQRWRGLKALVVDAVEHGSRAVERIQIETAKVPFDILQQIPPIEAPVKGVRLVHDTAVGAIHGMIRVVNRGAGATLDVVLDAIERHEAQKAENEK